MSLIETINKTNLTRTQYCIQYQSRSVYMNNFLRSLLAAYACGNTGTDYLDD
ncbi:hypothetical protein [Pseudomonas sp. TE3610]